MSSVPTKSLQRMAAPLVVSFTLRFMFTFVDLAYAAVLQDDNAAVAAIGLYAPIQSINIAIWVGLSAGFTASLSRAFGQRDEAHVQSLKRGMMAILAGLVPGLIALGVGIYLMVPHLGLEPALTDAFRIYATTLTLGMPITGFWSIYPDSIVKAHQDTRSTMVAGLASTFTNVALNTLFVFAFGWGIFGIALATVLSRFSGLAYALHRGRVLERSRGEFPATGEPLLNSTARPPAAAAILRLAVPGGVTFLLTAVESGLANKVLAGVRDATTAIASYAVFQQLLMLAVMPATATAIAVIPYVARLLPTGDVARIRRELYRTTRGVVAIALVMTTLMGWIFAAPLAEFFVQRRSGVDAGPGTLAALRLLPLAAAPAVPFLVLRPVFEAVHRPRLGVLVSVGRFALLSPPLILLGAAVGPELGLDGLRGVILGVTLATAVTAIATVRLVQQALVTPRA